MDKNRSALNILLNKLLEDKRYDDVMILAEYELENWKNYLEEKRALFSFPDLVFTNIIAHTALELVFLNLLQ